MPPRQRIQFRPKGDPNAPAYAPQRDLAYIYAPAMQEALRALDTERQTPDIAELIRKLGLHDQDIEAGVKAILEAHRLFVNEPDVETAFEALTKAGWYNQRIGVRFLIYGRLGEVILGGFFLALRDVSRLAEESAQQKEIADFIAAGRMLLYHGKDVEQQVAIDWREEAIARREELALQRKALEANQALLEQQKAGYRATITALEETVDSYRFEGFWSGLWRLIRRIRFTGRRIDNTKATS